MQDREYSDAVVTSDEVIDRIFWVYTVIYWWPASTFNEWLNSPDFFQSTPEIEESIKEYLASLSTNPLILNVIPTTAGALTLNDSHRLDRERIEKLLKKNPNLCREAITKIKVLNVLSGDRSLRTFENIISKFDEFLFKILKKVGLLSNPGFVDGFQKHILQRYTDIDSILAAEEEKLQKQQQLPTDNEPVIKLTVPQRLIDNKDKTNLHWAARNKWLIGLAAILVLMVIASIVTLVVLGLMASPWLAIPCLLLFTAVLVGVRIFYLERENTSPLSSSPEQTLSSTGKIVTATISPQLNKNDVLATVTKDFSGSEDPPSLGEPFEAPGNQGKYLWAQEKEVASPQNTTSFGKEMPTSELPGGLSAEEIFGFLKASYKNKGIENNTFLIWFGAKIPSSDEKNYLDNILKHKRNNSKTNVTLVVSRNLMKQEYYEELLNTCQKNGINLVDFDSDLKHLPNHDLVKKFIDSEAIPKPYNYVLASDILRFSLIYEFGGRYFDTDISSNDPYDITEKNPPPLGLKLIEGGKRTSIEMDAFMGHKGHFLFLLFMTAARYYGECAFDFLTKKPVCGFISTTDPNIEDISGGCYNSYILVKEEEIGLYSFEGLPNLEENAYLGYGDKYILFKDDKKLVYVEPDTVKPKVFSLTDTEVSQIEAALVQFDNHFRLNLKAVGTLDSRGIGCKLIYVDDTYMPTHIDVKNFEDFLRGVNNLQKPEYQDKKSGTYNVFYDQAKEFIFQNIDHRPITLERNIGQFVAQTTGYSMVAFSDLLLKLNKLIQADDKEECVILPFDKRTYGHVRDTTANSPALNKAEQTIIDAIGKETLEFMMNKAEEYGFVKQSSVPIKQQQISSITSH